ncbi:MAG: efflux RND transporter periplasmic adaptor subunit [Candidatus Paceibacterota bacterium]|jgi:multidrug efflux pump subunit AcrA (membrane-fusion protein)
MKNFLVKAKSYWVIIAIIIVIVLIAGYFFWSNKNGNRAETLTIQPAEFTQTVSVSGKVIPATSVELGFSRSGKIAQVPVIVGQQVGAGQLIAEIDSREASLALESAQIDLKKMLENSNASNQSELTKDYENSLSNVDKAYLDMSTIFEKLDLILNNYQVSTYKNNLTSDTARNYFRTAQSSFYKARDSYDLNLANYRNLTRPFSKIAISKLTEDTYILAQSLSQAINDVNTFVSFVYNQTDSSSRSTELETDKSDIASWRVTTSSMLATLSDSRNSLKDSTLNIESQRLTVAQKEHDYADYFLRAPITGTITRLDIKTGEQAIAGQASVSMISSGLFQIESFVPEINIANLKVGNPAEVTLDAYGSSVPFSAQVISIDPAETIHDGVSTYKVKLQFSAVDARIKPGMTANLLVTALKKPGVISIPASAITEKNGKKFVSLIANNQTSEVEITTGQIGFLGQTEVLTGLRPGDQIVLKQQSK